MSPKRPESLGVEHRLRATRDFDRVKQHGTPLRGSHCMLLALAQPGEPTRIGFIASRRSVGGAVQRNRARRRLREIVRRRFPRMPHMGFWLVFIAFRSTLAAPHQELASDVEGLIAGAGALEPLSGASA
jgi:ribonuclease P protein component